jgi:hypothetical protein
MATKYGTNVSIYLRKEHRDKLIAISYFVGEKGVYSKTIHRMLYEGIEKFEQELETVQKARFAEIFENIAAMSGIQPKKDMHKNVLRLKKKRGGI